MPPRTLRQAPGRIAKGWRNTSGDHRKPLYARHVTELPAHFRGEPMGEATISRAELAGHQRERVIAKATPVFARRGYQGTTVDHLLASGKIGVGNFYSLFEGKEDCFLATYDSILDRARTRIAGATAAADGWAQAAVLGLHEALALILADPLAARIVLTEAQAAGEKGTLRYEALLDSLTAWMREGRRGRPEAASLPPSFEQAAVAGLAFYLQQFLLEGASPELEDLFDEASALMLAPILGAEELHRLSAAVLA
jgi:AcrR family transcriptional regulator